MNTTTVTDIFKAGTEIDIEIEHDGIEVSTLVEVGEVIDHDELSGIVLQLREHGNLWIAHEHLRGAEIDEQGTVWIATSSARVTIWSRNHPRAPEAREQLTTEARTSHAQP